jgi:hypothetical protein
MEKATVGQWVFYKFDRKIVGGTTEQRIGRDPNAIKVEGVEVEARGIVLRVNEEDSTIDVEVYAKDGQYTFGHVANGNEEGQWRPLTSAAERARAQKAATS